MPTLYNVTKDSQFDYRNNTKVKSETTYKVYRRYAELKKRLREHLNESIYGQVQVYRRRRGEWGEWFEHWEIRNNKPTIVKQGWM